ncbi:response regulator [Hyalangium gracile]|uniref:response regulator n=1 Tax=Hyalangium gracile TaxID=394092 RepID=UPI001CCA31D8|nr:DUF4388 domain-containing protein [Hyalangium gracile]
MKSRILIVDDEEDILWSLQNRLVRTMPGVEIQGCTHGRKAMELISQEDFNLVISDVRLPEVSGIELLIHARKRNARLPFIITTAYPTEQMRMDVQRMGSVTYVEKPFELARLASLVNELLEHQRKEGFSGAVSLDTLPDLVQLFCFSSTTGGLRIWHGDQRGAIWFDRGTVVHAEAGTLEGEAAFYEILSWEGGEFAMERNAAPPKRTLAESATGLLMEAQRRIDEARRAPSLTAGGAPPDEWADFTEAPVAAPPVEQVASSEPPPARPESVEPRVAEALLAEALPRVSGMAGFVSLSMLHVRGAREGEPSGPQRDAAVRAFSEALAAAEQLATQEERLEEMLITAEHHHLFLAARGTHGGFFHLVMERSAGNVWLARLTLKEAGPHAQASQDPAGGSR